MGLDGEVIAEQIPVKQYRMLAAWLVIHEEELYRAWNLAVAGKPFDKIDPLC